MERNFFRQGRGANRIMQSSGSRWRKKTARLVNALKLKDISLINQDGVGSFWLSVLRWPTEQSYPDRGTCMAEEQEMLDQVVAILQIIAGLNLDAFALHELSGAIESMAEEKEHAGAKAC